MLLEVKGEAVVGEQRQSLLSGAPAEQGAPAAMVTSPSSGTTWGEVHRSRNAGHRAQCRGGDKERRDKEYDLV